MTYRDLRDQLDRLDPNELDDPILIVDQARDAIVANSVEVARDFFAECLTNSGEPMPYVIVLKF